MPFEAATYDAAYAIEATCHAAEVKFVSNCRKMPCTVCVSKQVTGTWLMQLKDVYGEIYRVLKPGALFTSYEWVGTKLYDPSNAEHVRIMDEINFGNGLPVCSSRMTLFKDGTPSVLAVAETIAHCGRK